MWKRSICERKKENKVEINKCEEVIDNICENRVDEKEFELKNYEKEINVIYVWSME